MLVHVRLSVKVGDLVKLIGSFHTARVGLIVAPHEHNPGWFTINYKGELLHWPEKEMEVISESR